jgi:uncharacterized protein YciI
MSRRRRLLAAFLATTLVGLPLAAAAQTPPASDLLLFAWELRTGPAWDSAKPPPEQQHFRAHSANLRRLRDEGRLVLGARYGDKGFMVLAAATLDEARAMIEADPAVRDKVFVYELHPFNVFYGGSVEARRR